MSRTFDFREPDLVTAATEGEPGARVFYLQGVQGGEVATLRCEKQQVAALAENLDRLVDQLGATDEPPPTDLEPQQPLIAEWVVGTIGLGHDESADRLVIVAEELVVDDEGAIDESADGGVARFFMSRAQVVAFVTRATALLQAGRPPCPICGRPMNPDGHNCPRSNGHNVEG